jgi:uncharacterized protein with HEPN domain
MFENQYIFVRQMLVIFNRIFEYSSTLKNADEFVKNDQVFDPNLIYFIALGEMAGKINPEFREKYNHVEWTKIYAFATS